MSYLKDREDAWIKEQMKQDVNREKEILKRMRQTIDEIQTQINANWENFSDGQKITISEAHKIALEMDVEKFARKAKEYVENKDFSPRANYELKLYNLAMRVSRLELLKAEIGLELVKLYDGLDKYGYGQLGKAAEEEYKRQAGILGGTVGKDYISKVEKAMNASFKSSKYSSFSDSIWQNFAEMKADLEKMITQAITQGKHPRTFATELMKFIKPGVENARYKAERLLNTEVANIQIDMQRQSYIDNDIDEYVYIAEPSACKVCDSIAKDGPYKVKDMQKGVNAPTMHPHCHCSTAGYVDREAFEKDLKARGL